MTVDEIIAAFVKFRNENPGNGSTKVFSECPETGLSWNTSMIHVVKQFNGEDAVIVGIDGPLQGPLTPDDKEYIDIFG